jgi:transposase
MTEKKPCSRDWKEMRRERALALKQAGWRQCEIAAALDVTPAAVSQWMRCVHEHGEQALKAHPHAGAVAKMTKEEQSSVPELLRQGAEAYGFRGEVWTCARVAAVIEQEFGVRYHRAHVSRLLRQLGWTPQRPIKRAVQRNEAKIEHWRSVLWPELKKRRNVKVAPWFLWMNPVSICCRVWCAAMLRVDKHLSCGYGRRMTMCQ